MNALLEPLAYDFMLKALLSSAAVGGVCALLSVYLMLKGWSLIGDALSHAVVPGVALAYLWRLPYALGAFTTGILAAAAMLLLKRLPMLRQDAIIGFVFTLFFAAGLFIISLYPTAVNLQAVIYGNILGIDDHDLWQMLAICAVSLIILACKWRDLMLLFFDDIQAVTAGLAVNRLRWLFFLLVSAAVVAALQTVGAILVIALLITLLGMTWIVHSMILPLSRRYLILPVLGIISAYSAGSGLMDSLSGWYGFQFNSTAAAICGTLLAYLGYLWLHRAFLRDHVPLAGRVLRRATLLTALPVTLLVSYAYLRDHDFFSQRPGSYPVYQNKLGSSVLLDSQIKPIKNFLSIDKNEQ